MLSILTVIIILLNAGYKLDTMISLADYKVQVHDLEEYYDSVAQFGTNDGFQVAAAVTKYDGSTEEIIAPEFG